jgi:single-stranded-DNA-specific exonuclease
MAAGLSLAEENIPALRKALNRDCVLTDEDFVQVLDIDAELPLEAVTMGLADEMERLAPFGRANDEPLFVSYGVYVDNVRVMDEKSTLIFSIGTREGTLKGIIFGQNVYYAEQKAERGIVADRGLTMDLVYAVEVNVYNGLRSVQARLRDFRLR